MTKRNTKDNIFRKRGYVWITLVFFIFSVVLHWVFGWQVYVDDQLSHNQPVVFGDYVTEMLRDTFENWQSEFLQLIWQVAGLAFLLYVGSPQSKEGDDRKEEKLDYIIKQLDPDRGETIIKQLEIKLK